MVEQMIKDRQLFPKDRLLSTQGKDGLPKRTEVWPNGVPIGRSYFREYVWKPAHKATGIQQLKFHALRGSHISWLLSGGADLVTVMERAGHEQISTTQAYIARMPDAEKQALTALAATRARYRGAS